MAFKELRKKAGFPTQESLALILNVKRSSVGMWETGQSLPKYETLIELAKLFAVSTDYLIKCFDKGLRR